MTGFTLTEFNEVRARIKRSEYNLGQEITIARRKLQSHVDSKRENTIYTGEILDDTVIACALECLINRL